MALQANVGYVELGHQVTHALASLDGDFGEVFVEEHALELRVGLQCNLHHLGLAVGVRREVDHAAAGLSLCEVVLAVARHAGDVEALDIRSPALAVAVDGVVDGA